MALLSSPNIPQADIVRLTLDDTTPIRYQQFLNGAAMDLTGHSYEVVWYNSTWTVDLATTTNDGIDRPDSPASGLLQWDPHPDLPRDVTYNYIVHRLDGSKREPKLWGSFRWTYQPPAYVEGQPIEPQTIAVNLDTTTNRFAQITLAAPVTGGGVAASLLEADSVAQGYAAPMPNNKPGFVLVGESVYLKTAAGLSLIPLGPPQTN